MASRCNRHRPVTVAPFDVGRLDVTQLDAVLSVMAGLDDPTIVLVQPDGNDHALFGVRELPFDPRCIGAGMFGAVGYLGLSAMAVMFSTIGFAWAIGYQAWFGLEILPALFWGFLTDMVTILLLAGLLAAIGKAQLKFSEPKATIAQAEASMAAVAGAVERGKDEVAGLSITGRKASGTPELR